MIRSASRRATATEAANGEGDAASPDREVRGIVSKVEKK
jgi:hypothetical protein